MLRRAAFLALAVMLLHPALPARGEESADLLRENRALQAELELAKTGKLYAVFDFPRLRILVKSKGILLRSIPVLSVSIWGDPVEVRALPLQGRSALQPPARPHLKPGDANYTPASARPNAEPEALELKDMPSEYRLVLSEGVSAAVRNPSGGVLSGFGRLRDWLSWVLGRPLATLRHSYRRAPYTDIRMVIEGPEAQALYWVLPEGTPVLVRDTGK